MTVCSICEKEESRYKCPKCVVPYCSLACFKKHKEIPCQIIQSEDTNRKIRKEITPIDDDEEEPSRLTPDDLDKLRYASEISEYLKDPELREIIKAIDSSTTPEKDLDAIRSQHPLFEKFTKELVEITFRDKLNKKNAQN